MVSDKNIHNYLKVSIFIALITIASCKKLSTNELIVGKWNAYDIQTNQNIENPESYYQAIEELKTKTQIEFKENNIFTGIIWGDTTYGTWQIVDDSLFIQDKSFKKSFKVYVKKITKDFLYLEQKDDSIHILLIFKRIG